MRRRYQCLRCGLPSPTQQDGSCRYSRWGHEWAPTTAPTELQREYDERALGHECPECRVPSGESCKGRRGRLLVRTHILRRLAVQAELGL